MPDAKAVEKNTDVAGIPPSDNIVGFTPKITISKQDVPKVGKNISKISHE